MSKLKARLDKLDNGTADGEGITRIIFTALYPGQDPDAPPTSAFALGRGGKSTWDIESGITFEDWKASLDAPGD